MASHSPGCRCSFIVTKLRVSVSEIDPNFLGLMLERQTGETTIPPDRPAS